MEVDQASSLRRIVRKKASRINKGVPVPEATGSNPPRVISVTSGKGGVGKTNLVGNLAVAGM